jgi:hypothetical protein
LANPLLVDLTRAPHALTQIIAWPVVQVAAHQAITFTVVEADGLCAINALLATPVMAMMLPRFPHLEPTLLVVQVQLQAAVLVTIAHRRLTTRKLHVLQVFTLQEAQVAALL